MPPTYYLSPVQCSHFLRLAERAGGSPPKEIEHLLLKQGGKYQSSTPFNASDVYKRQIHTHASSNDFSPLDKTYVMNGGRPLYVVFLNNSNGKVTVRKMRKAGNGTIRTTVANDVSFKKLTKAEKERVKKNIKRLHPKCGDPRCACSMINWMA